MERFRKIVVNDAAHQWLFRNYRHGYRKHPYLLTVKETVLDKALKIEFSITDHFLPTVFQGKKTTINLNRPELISQIIQYCLDHEDEILEDEHRSLNGINILQKMGFEISPIFLK